MVRGSCVLQTNKTIIPKFVEVFNIEVQDNENYFVTEDGVLVHNGYKKATVKDVEASTHDVEITISKSDYPETAAHIEDAIRNGQQNIVTIERGMAGANRFMYLMVYFSELCFVFVMNDHKVDKAILEELNNTKERILELIHYYSSK